MMNGKQSKTIWFIYLRGYQSLFIEETIMDRVKQILTIYFLNST